MQKDSSVKQRGTCIYLPTWLGEAEYKRLAGLPFEGVDRVILAFALPQLDGTIRMPDISLPLSDLLTDLAAQGTRIHLAIGGWGDDEAEHNRLLKAWELAGGEPHRFAEQVCDMTDKLQRKLELDIAGIDLDWEYPEPDQAGRFAALALQVKAHIGERLLSAAVPAEGKHLKGYEKVQGQLLPVIDVWNIMTYDRFGLWSPVAGHHAPGTWVLGCANAWVERVGVDQVSIGFPAYGYSFPGVIRPGQGPIGKTVAVMADQLDLSRVDEDRLLMASSLTTDRGWVTFQSPAMIRETRRELAALGITQTFAWSAEGITEEYLEALTS